jgi:hypothetical protein
MQGSKSQATKRREKLVAEGLIPPPRKRASAVLAGFKGAVAAGKVPPVIVDRKFQLLIQAEQQFGSSLVGPCLERIGRIALGQIERTPIATQFQAAQYIVDRYGKAKSETGGDAPLNELPALELLEALRAVGNEAAKRSAEDAEVLAPDQQSDPAPVESKP